MTKAWGLGLVVLALMSHARAYDWADDVRIWTAATVAQPHSPRAWLNRCAAESIPEWCDRAFVASRRYDARTQRLTLAIGLVNQALIAASRGRSFESKAYAQVLLRRFPQWPQSQITCDTVSCFSF